MLFKAKRKIIIIALLLFFVIVISSYQKLGLTWLNEILVYPLDQINGFTFSIYAYLAKYRDAIEENERLKKRLNELLIERHYYSEMMLENKRLKAVLALKENNPAFFTTAKAVARGYDRFLNTLIIDKGKAHGIVKNMAVVTVNGLVGKVYSVREAYSEVLLLNDQNFSAAVRLQKSRHEGIVSGTGRGYCLLKYIPSEELVQKDELVITSGLDGIFPAGIPVGVVSYIGRDSSEFFLYLEVTPFQSSSKVDEVVILKPLSDRALKHGLKE